jgi:hypothetical protein
LAPDDPHVFITASGDRIIRTRLLAQGTVECLFKPFSELAEERWGSGCLRARHAGRTRTTPGEERVQLRYDRGSLAYGRSHPLHRPAADVADGEDPLDPGL